jgi:hypothetical protein
VRGDSPKEVARANHRAKIREKVVQWCKDFWRPYHGSTQHREDSDGNQLVEKKKSGGHMPLNAAVMALWKPGKLKDSREMFERHLYGLAITHPVIFAEMQDLFGRYGAGDSDYDVLLEGARRDQEVGENLLGADEGEDSGEPDESDEAEKKEKDRVKLHKRSVMDQQAAEENARWPKPGPRCRVERRLKAWAVNKGIDLITDALIADDVGDRNFWADFPLEKLPRSGVRSERSTSKDERYRAYYLLYLEERDRLLGEGVKRPNVRAARNVANAEGTTDRTVREAVAQCESGYVDLGD